MTKGGDIVTLSDFQETIKYQFDCFVRKILIRAAMNYHNERSRRLKREITFSTLDDTELNQLSVVDTYKSDHMVFQVLNMDIEVDDELLAKALKLLPEKKRNIVLLFYYMDMSDSEIASVLGLVRSTVFRHRTNALLTIKTHIEEFINE